MAEITVFTDKRLRKTFCPLMKNDHRLMGDSIRDKLLASLPVSGDNLKIRLCERGDYDALAGWPPYLWPYDGFTLRFASMSRMELDQLHEDRLGEEDRVTLVADSGPDLVVGYVALVQIDWERGVAENMAIRLHPDHCDRGIGTRMLEQVRDWWFRCGMKGLRLDVAATNHRAVRSYLNAGFIVAGEFWREAPDLENVDMGDSRYDFLRGHTRFGGKVPETRFYWMEIMQRRLDNT